MLGTEGAPNAILEIRHEYLEGLERMQVGAEAIVIIWFHRAHRNVLKVHTIPAFPGATRNISRQDGKHTTGSRSRNS